MAQHYPPENGQGGVTFNTWYVDDVTGAMVPFMYAVRDYWNRLVDSRDEDELGRDELLAGWAHRAETPVVDP